MIEWDREKCLELIDEYRNMEILWNTRHVNYYNRPSKESAWNEIAAKIDTTVGEVKKKIESLKGSYRKEKSRQRTDNYETRWFGFEAFQFLDLIKEETNRISIKSEPETVIECEFGLLPSIQDDNIVHDEHNNVYTEGYTNRQSNLVQRRRFKPAVKRGVKRRLSKRACAPNKYEEAQIAEVYHQPMMKDECSTFGDFVSEKLRNFDGSLRALAQHKIHSVLFELEMSMYERNEENPEVMVLESDDILQ